MSDASAGREERARHWDAAYRDRGVAGVSWYQATPTLSLGLIRALQVAPTTTTVDVGGGASVLVDALLGQGFTDVSVFDVSGAALEASRRRLGPAGSGAVHWLHEDLLQWEPERRFGLWHDRAVLHFLTEEADRDAYFRLLRRALEPGGAVVIGTFDEDGPEQCSGLPVARYSARALGDALGGGFRVVATSHELHTTPGGVAQRFTWVAARAIRGA